MQPNAHLADTSDPLRLADQAWDPHTAPGAAEPLPKWPLILDYLHWANSLDLLSEHLPPDGGRMSKREFLKELQSFPGVNVLVGGYRHSHKKIDVGEFRRALLESRVWREQFRRLHCRGFSYELDSEMAGYSLPFTPSCRLKGDVDLRIALVANPTLFYPPRVRDYLNTAKAYKHHYRRHGLPAIAFCFGRKRPEGWFICVMQSDLVSDGPSCVREHFRGWRRVLFANVLSIAQGSTSSLYLIQANDADRARIHPRRHGKRLSCLWKSIYDQTAHDWGMKLVRLGRPVNVEILRRQKPVYADYFYESQWASEAILGGGRGGNTACVAIR